MPGELRAKTVLSTGAGAELEALRLLEELGLKLHLPQELLNDVKLAALEACLNALEHGRPPVEVEVAFLPGAPPKLEVVVSDCGPGFDPQGVPRPELAGKLRGERKRGWGLELMRRLVDSLRVEVSQGKTRLTLLRCLWGR